MPIPGSLQALLAHVIDYAGLYPPAALSLPAVTANYERYLQSPESWILNRLVLPASKLGDVSPARHWRITLLVEDEPPDPLPPAVEALEWHKPPRLCDGGAFAEAGPPEKAASLWRPLPLPAYCETAWPDDVPRGAFAKIRTGGLTPDAIPDSARIAGFLAQAAALRLPFKATAGLHHPIRSNQALTYEANSPRAVMHGFINVFSAAVFVWHGMDAGTAAEILNEEDAGAFEFREDALRWRGRIVSTASIREARSAFAHSFGSCSFEEPIAGLRALGLLL